jgi:hypothetical protein
MNQQVWSAELPEGRDSVFTGWSENDIPSKIDPL